MGSLYVGDLRADVDEFDLLHIFNATGKISSIHVCRDTETDKSLGYAYVNYCDRRSAENALIQLNYRNIKGKSCRVMWSHHAIESKITEGGNVFVKNLDKQIRNKDLHEIFSAFGKIVSCKVAMSGQEQSLGYGYVHFERAMDAERAIKKANRMFINGKEIQMEYFVSKGERMTQNITRNSQIIQSTHSNQPQENTTNLYINNLDINITDEMLEDRFRRFGEITSAKIERDQYNISKKFGFVCFRNPNAAAKAIEGMNGAMIGDHLVYVGYAQKKSERKELVSQRFSTNRPGPAKYTPNPETVYIKQPLTDTKPKYCLPKRHSFCSSTNDQLLEHQRPIKTRSATNSASAQSPTGTREAWTPKTRKDHTVTSIQHNFGTYTDTGIGKVTRPSSLISNEIPLRQRSRNLSSSSERLYDHVNSVKIRSVPSSPTREFSQNFTFEQRTKDLHPLTVQMGNKFDKNTRYRELSSPQNAKHVESIQHRISQWESESKDPIPPTKLSSGGTRLREPIPNHEDYSQPRIAEKVKHEMRRSNSQEFENKRGTRVQPPVSILQKSRIEPVNKTQVSLNEKQNSNQRITVDELRSMNGLEQKETLGAIIFPTIHSLYPNHAIRICETMVQTFGVEEIIQMFQSSDTLKSRIRTIKDNLRNAPANNTDREVHKRQNRVQTKHQTEMHSEMFQNETDVCIRSVEDKIYDTARREYPNEANLIVKLITEKCNKEQLQLLSDSESLLDHEVEKAHSKIRMLETPMCQNYA